MSTPLAVQQPGVMMLRARAQVRTVRVTACHAREPGPQEAGCPVRPPAHAAFEREDIFDVLLPSESRCRPIRTTAEATCGARSAGQVR